MVPPLGSGAGSGYLRLLAALVRVRRAGEVVVRDDGAVVAEITHEVDLCLPSGALNPAAVGWTRTPLHRANLRTGDPLGRASTWARTKRWDSWSVQTPEHCVVLQLSSLNYAALHEVWVLDRATGVQLGSTATVPLARDVRLPSRYGGGPARGQSGSFAVAFDPVAEGMRLRAVAPRLRLNLVVEEVRERESLGVVVPWSDRLFQYSLRQVALPVRGRMWLDEREITVERDDPSWAVAGFGRGRWPYSVEWISAVGSGLVDGVTTGLQLGGRWTDGTGTTENAVVLDGRVHRINEDLSWAYDAADRGATWFVTGDRVQVQLRPFHVRSATTKLGVLSTTTYQSFGTWTGWVVDDAGERRRVDGLVGWAEDVTSRW
ncbi:DUF2804 domain-containing protein [Georgenia muralis]|uniref:DUF2804 domain-containing protein n=1 Tax=Georgenia muralis TaxID=154117 RepID=UPI000F4D4F37|nr:DUF2804 domain-containing protein [Georgenia muralis]